MKKKVLITGINGFVGEFLKDELLKDEFEIHGTTQHTPPDSTDVVYHEIDLLLQDQVVTLLEEINPEVIYHLAALTSPAESFKDPMRSIHDNAQLELNILEGVRKLNIDSRILVASSAEVYGKVEEKDLPLTEEAQMRPLSPYGVSKITQDFLALQYHLSYDLDIIRVRPFNHIGPGQTPHFVVPAFAKQIAEIEKGKQDPIIKVGNIETKRDFTDVRDIIRAYVLLVEKGMSGDVYNIGSGISHKISEILDMLIKMSGKEIKVEKDDSLLRPSDILETRCDNTKIKNTTGWSPEIPLEKSLEDTLNYWREQV